VKEWRAVWKRLENGETIVYEISPFIHLECKINSLQFDDLPIYRMKKQKVKVSK
jgi:hypothetical protein